MARREHRQRFWAAIADGAASEDAGIAAGVPFEFSYDLFRGDRIRITVRTPASTLAVAAEVMALLDTELARRAVSPDVPRAEIIRLCAGATPAKLARVRLSCGPPSSGWP